ncbi:hypothetical protein AAFF_G00326570 [Aldrovandia affinis]|uniref:Reverse transcriptase RNase H-like domain-containing protein n=1 Tax=Aldrovandia affinis TaxID=143900 RepID=A0AAD7T9A5_9TELE|nr:hypothetical protein AAFF_G00326570 [Aldrovandia affinis]
MTSIKRSSPGAIPEPRTQSLPLLPRRNATLVSGSGTELREVEEATRELEERLGVQRRRKTGATETAMSAELQGRAVRQERAPERPYGVSMARQPASTRLTATRRRRKSAGHAHPRSSDDSVHRRYDVAAATAEDSDGERAVAYYSGTLSQAERNYCMTRRELLAVVKALRHFRPYLQGSHFHLRTDHASLTWLLNFKHPEGQVARWLEELQECNFQIEHRAGRHHTNADALSCCPCAELGCGHCHRQEEKSQVEPEVAAVHTISEAGGCQCHQSSCGRVRRLTARYARIDLRPTTHLLPKTQLADRKVAALSPQHHRQRRRRHRAPRSTYSATATTKLPQ